MSRTYFAYIRVSTVRQGERGSSLAEQKSAIEAYAARNGLRIANWFEEMNTAAKQGRRCFTQMLAALRIGEADGLIIHKIDRSARNLRDWSDLGDLIDRGIDVRFVSDNFDLLSRGGRLSADIQAVVAADYIRNLREEVMKGMLGRLKQGIFPFAAPVGYLNTGKGAVKLIDPVKGPLVRHLFERYASNTVSLQALRHELASKGLHGSNRKPLSPAALSRILNNTYYMGVIRIKTTGDSFPGAHEPLIPKALFERVQAILRGKTVSKAKKHQFLLRQIVRCGRCGRRTLTGEIQKSRVYYRCHGPSCRGVSWSGEELEGVVLDHIVRARLDLEGLGEVGDILRDMSGNEEDGAARLMAAHTLQLQRLDGRIARLTDLLIDGAIDRDMFNARKQGLLIERQGLLEAINGAQEPPSILATFEMFERQNNELLRYEVLLDDEKRELIEIVCSNFTVHGKTAAFTLRSPFREMSETANQAECGPHRTDVRTRQVVKILQRMAESAATSPKSPRPPERHQRFDQLRLHSDKAAA